MKRVTMTDRTAVITLHVREEPPPFPRRLEEQAADLRAAYEEKERPLRFLDFWKKQMSHYKLTYVAGPEQFRLAGALVRKHSQEDLERYATTFFRMHADALYEGTYDRSLILFASKLEEVKADMENQV